MKKENEVRFYMLQGKTGKGFMLYKTYEEECGVEQEKARRGFKYCKRKCGRVLCRARENEVGFGAVQEKTK